MRARIFEGTMPAATLEKKCLLPGKALTRYGKLQINIAFHADGGRLVNMSSIEGPGKFDTDLRMNKNFKWLVREEQ